MTALTNALDARAACIMRTCSPGTRGVGKTTIARILAKSLNCVTGVTATPCGVCAACTDIDAGRFVDLLELDAASNTGIDNMREILDNARYAPTVGRYKVYLIDEVHMLSKAAFNSMLKTLEEPPEHVKFVLATTDPQKIPVTVLSRCLQFNLKPLPPATIERAARAHPRRGSDRLRRRARWLCSRAPRRAALRDALSLLDQAIAFGGGEVREAGRAVDARRRRSRLRLPDRRRADRRATAPRCSRKADALAARGLAFAAALDELASLFHRVAVAQVVPGAVDGFDDAERVARLRGALSRRGRAARLSDLCAGPRRSRAGAGRGDRLLDDAAAAAGVRAGAGSGASAPRRPQVAAQRGSDRARDPRRGDPSRGTQSEPRSATSRRCARRRRASRRAPTLARSDAGAGLALPDDPPQWPAFVAALKLTGMAAQLAAQTELKSLAATC